MFRRKICHSLFKLYVDHIIVSLPKVLTGRFTLVRPRGRWVKCRCVRPSSIFFIPTRLISTSCAPTLC